MELSTFWNVDLAKHPMNWAIVWIFATIWLLAFHVIMQGYGAMSGQTQPAISAGPGTVAIPPSSTSVYSVGGALASGTTGVPPNFYGGGYSDGTWPSDAQAKYAEDGFAS